jgi:D-3-phosphoglycerate dehydrogenase
MKVIVYDPYISAKHIEAEGFEFVTLDELYERADYITIHVPKMDSTIDLLDAEAFGKMKDGVMVINCARGGIINESDLYDAIRSGKVAGAALDVFSTEPPGDHPLLTLDQVISTPHLGASTAEAQTNVAVAAANQIIAYLLHDTVMNAVNVPSVTGEVLKQLKPYLYLGEKMGVMHGQTTKGGIKQVDIEYIGQLPDLDLKPITISAVKGLLSQFVQHEVNSVNAISFAKEMGIKISESTSKEAGNFLNMIRMTIVTDDDTTNILEGTIFGKDDARIVRINKFRLEVIPEGYLSLIHNIDKPGSIGQMGVTLGKHNINISRMMVGREDDGDRNIIFLRTDTPVPPEVIKEISDLDLVVSMTTFEL